jgi:hypothetical protein
VLKFSIENSDLLTIMGCEADSCCETLHGIIWALPRHGSSLYADEQPPDDVYCMSSTWVVSQYSVFFSLYMVPRFKPFVTEHQTVL